MFFPEYSITNQILKNIANIDYSRGIIENTPILQTWEKQLKKEADIKILINLAKENAVSTTQEDIKKYLDGLSKKIPQEIENFNNTLLAIDKDLSAQELDENFLKDIHALTTKNIIPQLKQGIYRNKRTDRNSDPEEILADIVDLFDWYNSRDAKETHPILLAGIIKAQLLDIAPFEQTNYAIASLSSSIIINTNGYNPKKYICSVFFEPRYRPTKSSIDLTDWLQQFTEILSYEYINVKEKVLLLGRNTKVARASGRHKLTERQERIIEYLQDYGILRNSDFSIVFKGVSEDSVLRDLKVLISDDIVTKSGSTKSSIYELK